MLYNCKSFVAQAPSGDIAIEQAEEKDWKGVSFGRHDISSTWLLVNRLGDYSKRPNFHDLTQVWLNVKTAN